jgi:hypothetical protein
VRRARFELRSASGLSWQTLGMEREREVKNNHLPLDAA